MRCCRDTSQAAAHFLLPGISIVLRAVGDGPVHGVELIGETLEKMNIKTR
jgi:hypothetical protein